MKKILFATALAAGTIFGMAGQASAACGNVSIAEMNWASAQLMANVDKIVLEEGYGCKVEIVPADDYIADFIKDINRGR
ncbi:MAG: glycine betaine ABC transporter substrate-binding protein, partial [Candidatus Puniceispirillum sp.]